ncbi:hypothetical protein [Azospirillum sp. sgz302134]
MPNIAHTYIEFRGPAALVPAMGDIALPGGRWGNEIDLVKLAGGPFPPYGIVDGMHVASGPGHLRVALRAVHDDDAFQIAEVASRRRPDIEVVALHVPTEGCRTRVVFKSGVEIARSLEGSTENAWDALSPHDNGADLCLL